MAVITLIHGLARVRATKIRTAAAAINPSSTPMGAAAGDSVKNIPHPRKHPAFAVKIFVDAEAKRHGEDGRSRQAQNRPGQPRAIAHCNRSVRRNVMNMAYCHDDLLRS